MVYFQTMILKHITVSYGQFNVSYWLWDEYLKGIYIMNDIYGYFCIEYENGMHVYGCVFASRYLSEGGIYMCVYISTCRDLKFTSCVFLSCSQHWLLRHGLLLNWGLLNSSLTSYLALGTNSLSLTSAGIKNVYYTCPV